MKTVLKIFGTAFAIIILSTIFVSVISIDPFAGQETVECNQWAQQAKTYSGFYLTQWQADQCQHYNIAIDAPVEGRASTVLAQK